MQTYKLHRQQLNIKDYVKRTALERDAKTLIDHDAIVIDADTNEVVLVYKILPPSKVHSDTFRELQKIKYAKASTRVSGVKNPGETKVLGYIPRNRAKTVDQACRLSKLFYDNPTAHAHLMEYAKVIGDVYRDADEARYKRHQELIKKANDDYIIPGTLFTSGIVNKNNPLKYHYDSGNFRRVSSAMIAFKHDIEGGHLCLPEYGIKLKIQDRSISLFDGQEILHGVTPIIKKSNQAMRFTVVYYSLAGIWSCLPVDEEIANARMARWESELKKYERKRNA